MNVLFVHGWAGDRGVWNNLAKELARSWPQAQFERIDLGYFGAPRECRGHYNVAVGHSLGAMWLLKNEEVGFDWFVSLAGFTRFAAGDDFRAGIAPAVLVRMQRNLARDPEGQIGAFWSQAAGDAAGLRPEGTAAANTDRLARGLDALKHWDCREQWGEAQSNCRGWLAIAGQHDRIVPASLSRACFSEVSWIDTHSHLLPITHPETCAQMIGDTIRV